MFLNHEDVHKLSNSLLINVNENQFRIFFTDDQITCFAYSSIGHTTSNCKKNNGVKSKNDHPIEFNEMNTHDTTSDTLIGGALLQQPTEQWTLFNAQLSPYTPHLMSNPRTWLNSLIPLWTFWLHLPLRLHQMINFHFYLIVEYKVK